MADPGFSPEHLGSGGVGAVLTAFLMWASKFWRRNRDDGKLEGRQAERFKALEAGQVELRNDMRDFRKEHQADMRELRELLMAARAQGAK